MARKPRVEFEGALYHVIVRGNHRRDIFRDESDRVAYLERIEHYRERYRCIVYAYVLMSNHVHLLIETGAVGLSKIMQGIQFSYTQFWLNIKSQLTVTAVLSQEPDRHGTITAEVSRILMVCNLYEEADERND